MSTVSNAAIAVETPSRLHLGMFAFGPGHRRQYGGVGLMIRPPDIRVILRSSKKFSCNGCHAARAERVAQQISALWLDDRLPNCELSIERAPPAHIGLGVGTQLALAVGVGLTRFCEVPQPPSPTEMAVRLGRARRSSVGTYGFKHGGLIVEAGHAQSDPIGLLMHRLELPDSWRVVVAAPASARGMSGDAERKAFAQLPAVPQETADKLNEEVTVALLPSARAGDFRAFSRSVFRFNQIAGDCFAAVQSGTYAPIAAPLIDRLREKGIEGVGQTSWGPTVFAFVESESAACKLRQELASDTVMRDSALFISRVSNHGAVVNRYSF